MLGEIGIYGHGRSMARAALQIPLLFFGSAAIPEFHHSDYAVQLDIAPTIVDLVGLRVPPSWQGRALSREATNPWSYHQCTIPYLKREDAVVFRIPPRVLKYSFSVTDPDNRGKQRLYDLISDSAEKNDLVDSPAVSAPLLQEIRDRVHAHFRGE
jgi:arylsulfatase A-like enzyme